MNSKDYIVLVNFWGLGDLISSFEVIRNFPENKFYIITPQNKYIIKELTGLLEIDSQIDISPFSSKYLLMIEIFINIFLGRKIIFTAPLGGKSRVFAKFLSIFYSKIILSKEYGNIYKINKMITF